jgi:hypothetical protein
VYFLAKACDVCEDLYADMNTHKYVTQAHINTPIPSRDMNHSNKDKCRGWVGFSVKMAHRITAGCDILLMPSRFEPCGECLFGPHSLSPAVSACVGPHVLSPAVSACVGPHVLSPAVSACIGPHILSPAVSVCVGPHILSPAVSACVGLVYRAPQ